MQCNKRHLYSITSSAIASSLSGTSCWATLASVTLRKIEGAPYRSSVSAGAESRLIGSDWE